MTKLFSKKTEIKLIKLISSRLIDIETENSQLKKYSKKFKDEIQSLKKQVRSLEKKSESPSPPQQVFMKQIKNMFRRSTKLQHQNSPTTIHLLF